MNEIDKSDEEEQDDLGDGLYEHHFIKVDKGQELLRIDKFILIRIQNSTRTKIQTAIDAGFITVNGKPIKSNYKVKPFDEISIRLNVPPRTMEIKAENIPLDIVFEDDYLCIINKPPGMVVHPAYGHYTGTLVNALLYHYNNLPVRPQKLDGDIILDRVGLVHRIDKNTSGIILIAKTEQAMVKLSKLFYDRDIDRKYIAIVWGTLKEDTGTIIANIGRDLKNRKIMAAFPAGGEIGKHAVTHWKVLKRLPFLTIVECKLETGRTHQIRVHFKSIGHPLFNDDEYGGDKILKGQNTSKYKQFVQNCMEVLPRQALHAKTLGFVHPITQEKVHFDSELPGDMQQFLEKWEANFSED
ncbi:MAG: RluA family pseudouridine synthase [Bacteroidia bacterium]